MYEPVLPETLRLLRVWTSALRTLVARSVRVPGPSEVCEQLCNNAAEARAPTFG